MKSIISACSAAQILGRVTGVALLLALVLTPQGIESHLWAQGLILPGAGATNRAMGGASTAAAFDAAGAGYWNPAVIRALPGNEISFSAEMLYADTHVSSSIPANAIGGVFPVTDRAGTDRSDSGLSTIPTIAMVYHPEDSNMTYGLGVYAVMGGSVNFPGSDTNPILTPQNPPPVLGGTGSAPYTIGLGPQHASAAALQIAPMVAMQLNEKLTVGGGLMINSMSLTMDPAFFGPQNANGTFPAATGGHPT